MLGKKIACFFFCLPSLVESCGMIWDHFGGIIESFSYILVLDHVGEGATMAFCFSLVLERVLEEYGVISGVFVGGFRRNSRS